MTIILGAGISGISAGYHLSLKGIVSVIYEQDSNWGGLCGNFTVSGFRFDKAIHLSFTEDEHVKKLFSDSCEYITHKPLAYNYYKGSWLKHPAQNNLQPLALEEKIEIINDFVEKDNKKVEITNYEEWLKVQYGNYFSEHFPLPYTRKYWGVEAKELSITWVGNRMYQPKIKEVLKGAFEEQTPNTYYAKEMRYPKEGGYRSFLKGMAEKCHIELNKKVINIDPENKIVLFKDGHSEKYDKLISSISLPEYIHLLHHMPNDVKEACNNLTYTSVALVSIGLNKPTIPKHLWFYIYDEEILPARCYSPSIKSSDNVPQGCSSFQFEVYFTNKKPCSLNETELIEHVLDVSERMGIFNRRNVIVKNYKVLEYGNVIFHHDMEKNRKIVLDYLTSRKIKTIGRFGKWEYLWSDQSLLSGKKVTDEL